MKVSGVFTCRRSLARCTVGHLGRVPKVEVLNRTRRGKKIVSFLMKSVRRFSVKALLSHLNVTIHAKRRYTRPLVRHLNVRNAMHTSLKLCGAGRRVSTLIRNILQMDEVFTWVGIVGGVPNRSFRARGASQRVFICELIDK